MSLRIVLMGTGGFALPAFRALLDSPHDVCGVVTQPERTGRGHHRHVNPVRVLGEESGVPVWQPENAGDPHFLETLRQSFADVIFVAAYGQILKPALLAIPRLGAFNLHGSVLPRHRGAAPVQYTIWKGDSVSGLTIFQIEPGLDSGPVAMTHEDIVRPGETAGELMQRLADEGAPLTRQFLDRLERGAIHLTPQNSAQATLAPRISKQDGRIDWSRSPREIDCHIRAMLPWPKTSSILRRPQHADLRCIVHRVAVLAETPDAEFAGESAGAVGVHGHRMFVRCGAGCVELLDLQPEGRRVMQAAEFLNGHPDLQTATLHAE